MKQPPIYAPRGYPKQDRNYRTIRSRLGERYGDYLRLRRAGMPFHTAYPQILRQVMKEERDANNSNSLDCENR